MTIPKVSILIPTYNGARYLAATLESALSQSFGDFELIVCDDGSKDETVSIVRDYQKKDHRIRFFQNPTNLGLVQNWNHALMLAQGEWIKYLFQDDLLTPKALEKMLCVPDSASMVCSKLHYILEPGIVEETRDFFEKRLCQIADIYPGKKNLSYQDISLAAFDHFPTNIIGEPVAILFHRRAISLYGLANPDMIQCCDYEYFLRLAANEGLFFIDEPLVSFRVHPDSATANNMKKRFRKDTMDNLILRHEIVFNPHYHKFRAAVCEKKPNMDFVNLFAWFARDTFQRAHSDPEDLEYFLEIAAKYPAISLCKKRFKIFSSLFEKICGVISLRANFREKRNSSNSLPNKAR
ncbi:MAG TPA: hypothetical protein DD723_01580 [Candidatus Omnitrophica bacterium]|nr:hypothetical protein [Candidatus Omnitrophota bacterium]